MCKLLEIMAFMSLHKKIKAVIVFYVKQNDFTRDI